jgi:hypothetical protein
VPLDVFCVEQGRWSSGPTKFSSSGQIVAPNVRRAAQGGGGQGGVWSEVASTNQKAGRAPSTGTYQAVAGSPKVQEATKAIEKSMGGVANGKNVVGVVIAIGDEFVWLDRFASPQLFARYWPKLLKSYAASAATFGAERKPNRTPTVREATAFLTERTGKGSFKGDQGVYRLVTYSMPHHKLFELIDLAVQPDAIVHVSKSQK